MATKDFYSALFKDIVAVVNSDKGDLPKEVRATILRAFGDSFQDIAEEYERLMHEIGAKFMQDPDGQLDRHKCVACFMIAVMTKLDIGNIEQNVLTPKLTREKIAIDVGLSILITLIKGNRAENPDFLAFLNDNNDKFEHPVTLCDEGSYYQNWALCLYHCREDGCLHVLPLSNTLFLLETFNRKCASKHRGATNDNARFQPLN